MPRRKQDCPKRMKWEGGEGTEEGSPDNSDKLEGDDASAGSMSPNSASSPVPAQDEENPLCGTPSVVEPASPTTPTSLITDAPDATDPVSIAHNHLPLPERDLSPRCQSRDSVESSVPPRCPSGESMYSERGGLIRALPLPGSALSPVGVALPATLPPAAAAALLPQHSAAMAAYLGAAAAAAQHSHRLMMTSPLPGFPRGPVSPLVTSSSSPPGVLPLSTGRPPSSPTAIPLQSPIGTELGILDFSTKKNLIKHIEGAELDSDAMNLSKPNTPPPRSESSLNSPLDLSVTSRKRGPEEMIGQPPSRKTRSSEYKPVIPQWPSPVAASHLPYFAAAVAAASNMSPKQNHLGNHNVPESALWNGKIKHGTSTPSDASKALEKMSELSKLGGEDLFRSMSTTSAAPNSATSRHSAWQSHWLNKGAEQAKDVLKCVWCKQSFPSLAAMTTHMKEAKHCGVNVPVPPMQSTSIPPPQHQPPISTPSTMANSVGGMPSSVSANSNKPNQSDLNLLIKETMPLPRKLVRGQDVWLGKGAEQTRQILKCMWCGQSFRSLAEMTSHMQQTQHYTNIISQEQIISWKSTDDAKGGGGGSGGGSTGGPTSGTSSHVSAVLTCKVCDQAFSSLKELSNHMVKNSHYKEHIMRSITESGGRRRQTREKRKKSLPVRKLLELERAQHEFKNGDAGSLMGTKARDQASAGRITCEKCGEKIETSLFVDHIRQCVGGGSISSSQRNFLKNALLSNNIIPPENTLLPSHVSSRENRKSVDESSSPISRHRSPSSATDLTTSSGKDSGGTPEGNSSSPSVLNAIEKLIEKSFDSRARQSATGFPGGPGGSSNAPIGSSILKRLGIDESVDYTKPLVDPQTMNILRSYHHQQNQHHFGRRERSGSESSSVSERGSSRVDALTPDRKMDPPGPQMTSTPRTTPDKRVHTPSSDKLVSEGSPDREISVKKEIDEDRLHEHNHQEPNIKREEFDENEDDDRNSYHSNGGITAPRISTDSRPEEGPEVEVKRSDSRAGMSSPLTSPRQPTPSTLDPGVVSSPCRNSTCSPASSDRSGTPRSTNGSEKKPNTGGSSVVGGAGGGSLGALSSMFDSLSGINNASDGGSSSGRRSSSHPLAALQKLCDKTETHHSNNNRANVPSVTGTNVSPSVSTGTTMPSNANSAPGAILAFSWACNDAVMTSDSIMKCAFCDTPFISKGAYRHHLSKMHFVKDGVIPDPVALKVQQPSGSALPASTSAGKSSAGAMAAAGGAPVPGSGSSTGSRPNSKSPPSQSGYEESPHSKFLKYTELAKQLSSKYV